MPTKPRAPSGAPATGAPAISTSMTPFVKSVPSIRASCSGDAGCPAVACASRAFASGAMDEGDCFGETSYVRGARRTATIRAESAVSVLRVSSTLLEQVSAACQLRFNRVFLRALVSRLQGNEPAVE